MSYQRKENIPLIKLIALKKSVKPIKNSQETLKKKMKSR